MRTVLKIIGGLILGIVAGLMIAMLGIVAFTDTTATEFFNKLISTDLIELGAATAVGIATFLVSIAILIPIHEVGHLIGGLLSGYRFVSFRIFNYTIIKIAGKLKIKKFAIAGTGGQCLLTPPERPLRDIPTVLYNLGGVLANIIVLLPVLPLTWMDVNPFVSEAAFIFVLTDAFIILMNGIPMRINGMGNDGHNLIEILRNPESKRAMVIQLRSNAMIQNGTRPKDMPGEWFKVPPHVNYKNALEASLPIMAASRLLDEMRFEEALDAFEELYARRDEIMPLYVNEIACELAYLRLISGKTDAAKEILDEKLRKYIETYRKVMSSKERLHFAITLYINGDSKKAVEIFNSLNARQSEYLLQGEISSDLALMEKSLKK